MCSRFVATIRLRTLALTSDLDTIEKMRLEALNRIYGNLEGLLMDFVDPSRPLCADPRLDACRLPIIQYHLLKQLRRWQIWPKSSYPLQDQTVALMLFKLRESQPLDVSTPLRARNGPDTWGYNYVPLMFKEESRCRCVKDDLRSTILKLVEREEEEKQGLCLACVKATVARGKPLTRLEAWQLHGAQPSMPGSL